jgi:type II restriction enzyme
MYLCLEESSLSKLSYKDHLTSSESLITPYEQTRAGFVALALEKNRKATPYVEEAKTLKALTKKVIKPIQLLDAFEVRSSIITAAGVSDKAANHLTEEDKTEAIKSLIKNFLEPAGKDFIDELIYRFLLTRGDTLGGSIRNLAGSLGEKKFSRTLISTLTIQGKKYSWLHSKSRKWIDCSKDDADIELHLKGLHWTLQDKPKTLIYNLTVPVVRKNVDFCLFNASPDEMIFGNNKKSCHFKNDLYVALGELKGGIDPAGADEHWKTANTALDRIRNAFSSKNFSPKTFFIGAAIEKAMAEEIYDQLLSDVLDNAANLTDDDQLVSICKWLINL